MPCGGVALGARRRRCAWDRLGSQAYCQWGLSERSVARFDDRPRRSEPPQTWACSTTRSLYAVVKRRRPPARGLNPVFAVVVGSPAGPPATAASMPRPLAATPFYPCVPFMCSVSLSLSLSLRPGELQIGKFRVSFSVADRALPPSAPAERRAPPPTAGERGPWVMADPGRILFFMRLV